MNIQNVNPVGRLSITPQAVIITKLLRGLVPVTIGGSGQSQSQAHTAQVIHSDALVSFPSCRPPYTHALQMRTSHPPRELLLRAPPRPCKMNSPSRFESIHLFLHHICRIYGLAYGKYMLEQ